MPAAVLALLLLVFLLSPHARAALTFSLGANGTATPIGDRGEFTDHACLAYQPTGASRGTTIFLDPGHGGPDPGGAGTAPDGTLLQEKQITLAVALDMLPVLRSVGYRVVLSRDTDTSVAQLQPGYVTGGTYTIAGEHADLTARLDCANAAGAQLLLSVHFNSYNDPTVGGTETLYDADRPFSSANLHFASLVQQDILAGFAAQGWTVPDRGVTLDTAGGTPALTAQGAQYGHLFLLGPAAAGWLSHPSTMPGALCEPLFLTDPGEAAVAESTTGQQVMAASFVHAINQYFAVKH